jgi:hypothetical protein
MNAFLRTLAAATIAATLLAACGHGGHSRGIFHGHVVGKTEAEIKALMGEPAEIDRKNADSPSLVYLNKTFDPDNSNKVDVKTTVFLHKDDKGNIVAYDTSFVPG